MPKPVACPPPKPPKPAKPFARCYFKRPKKTGASLLGGTSFTPMEVLKAYGFPSDLTGAGVTIAYIELGGGFNQRDLDRYFKRRGIIAPTVKFVGVDGARNTTGTDDDIEVRLDLTVGIGVAPRAKHVVYKGPNTAQGFINTVDRAIADKVDIISISWGAPEPDWPAGSMDRSLVAANDAGINVYVASGDSGSGDGEIGSHCDYPAASPYTVSCGGTTLVTIDGLRASEVVWNDNAGGASGGGLSLYHPRPPFQPASVGVKRSVPDVAAVGDPATGWLIPDGAGTMVVGGTSAVAPFFAALNALLNQKIGGRSKYLTPQFYKNTRIFNDIVNGNNGTYVAHPGVDQCTGLGSPVGSEYLARLK